MKRVIFGLALVLGIAAAVPAQSNFVAYGKLQAMGMVSICWQPSTHVLEASNLYLTAEQGYTPNMNAYVGQWVKIEGTYYDAGSSDPICPFKVRVRKVSATKTYLDMLDRQVMGTPLNYTVYGPTNAFAVLMMGPSYRSVLPMGPWGALFLDILPPSGYMYAIGAQQIGTSGMWKSSIPLPNVPALQYSRFRFQAALVYPNPIFQPNLVNVIDFQLR